MVWEESYVFKFELLVDMGLDYIDIGRRHACDSIEGVKKEDGVWGAVVNAP